MAQGLRGVPCCAVLCRAVPCCAVLCRAVPAQVSVAPSFRDECHKGAKWLAKLLEAALGADVKLVQVGGGMCGARGEGGTRSDSGQVRARAQRGKGCCGWDRCGGCGSVGLEGACGGGLERFGLALAKQSGLVPWRRVRMSMRRCSRTPTPWSWAAWATTPTAPPSPSTVRELAQSQRQSQRCAACLPAPAPPCCSPVQALSRPPAFQSLWLRPSILVARRALRRAARSGARLAHQPLRAERRERVLLRQGRERLQGKPVRGCATAY